MKERIIFTLSYEKRWDCWLVYANRAVDHGDFFQVAGRYSGGLPDVPQVVEEVMPLITAYESSSLFHRFGKKEYKDERDFLQHVSDTIIRENIRPYIEKSVVQVLDTLADAGFPLFLKNSRLDNYYTQQSLFLKPVAVSAVLRFERTGDFTRYILRLKEGERVFYPADYELKVLTRKPCRVLAGRRLFRFPEDFDGQRLQPFLQKREVMIPKANEQLYFRKFILKSVRYEEIEVQGFEVIVHEPGKRAILSLEREVFGMPVLVLGFRYGKLHLPYWSERKLLVELHTDGDQYAFYKICRDFAWEREQAALLVGIGLQEHTSGCFHVKGVELPSSQEKKLLEESADEAKGFMFEVWAKTVGWVAKHTDDLKRLGIAFTQQSLRRQYYTGGWEMKFSVQTETDWFELKAEVMLADGRRIPLLRFRDHILSGNRVYVLDDGTVFLIPEEWFASYSDLLLLAGGRDNALYVNKSQYMLLDGLQSPADLPLTEEVAVDLPGGLRALLRLYQQAGYTWLYRLYHAGLGGCLADDMGLGKTLQIITLLLKYREEGIKPAVGHASVAGAMQLSLFDALPEEKEGERPEYHTCLIVVPASLVHNWRNELRKFAPQLTVTLYAGQNRVEKRAYLQRSDVVLVTYHTLRNDIDYLARLSFGIVVADEAQALKNPDSQLHQAMMRISGRWFYALSGTPVENSLSDLWSVLNFVNRNMLGSHQFFKKHFVKPLLSDSSEHSAAVLRKLVSPYILRRTKEEVLSELPELTSELVVCDPEEEQRKVYEEEQSRVRNYIMDKHIGREGLRSDVMVLRALIRLRQIANHPRLVDAGYTAGSGKLREVFRMLEGVTAAGHKVLVFSSFVKYLNLVGEELERRGWDYTMLTGGTKDREEKIRYFSTVPECRVFLISLKAGGVGLNLTEADYVFILDPWWNLAAENQAVSRAHRMGQKRAVFVYRFITEGTLEAKILAIQQRKQRLSEAVYIAASSSVPLTDDELLETLVGK